MKTQDFGLCAEMDNMYFLSGDSQASNDIRRIDWSTNPLGSPEYWPIALKTAVQMMLASHFPKAVVWGPDYVTLYNDAFRPILGAKGPCMGKPFNVIWAEVWHEIGPIAQHAYAGEATFIEDYPLIIDRFGYPEQTYFTFCYSPIRNESGSVGGMMDTVIETTGKVNAEKQAIILNEELAHRMRNLFALVHAISSQTFRDSNNREDVQAFEKRLLALSGAHDVLVEGHASRGQLRALVRSLAKSLSIEDRMVADGPPVALGSRAALSFSLLMHELMTNAIKHGALSKEGGSIDVRWAITNEPEPILHLKWVECGGPPAGKPTREGFGSKLLSMGLTGTGGVQTSFGPQGFGVEMKASLSEIQQTE